jgi:hypothetical protein
MVFGADWGEDQPLIVSRLIDEKHAGGGTGLANGLGLPLRAKLDHEEVVAQLGLVERHRVGGKMLVNEPQLPVIRGLPVGVL